MPAPGAWHGIDVLFIVVEDNTGCNLGGMVHEDNT